MSTFAFCQEAQLPSFDSPPTRSSTVGNGFPLPFGFAPKSTADEIGEIQPTNADLEIRETLAPVVEASKVIAPTVKPVSHEQVIELSDAKLNVDTVQTADSDRTPILSRKSGGQERASSRSRTSRSLTTTFSGLCIVLGLLMGFVWLAKRNGTMRTSSHHAPLVEVLASYRIGPRNDVSVVRFGSKLLALSVTGNGTETLAELNDPQEVAYLTELCGSTNSASVPFQLRQAIDNLAADSRSPRSTYHS